jgi:hypothetical protein
VAPAITRPDRRARARADLVEVAVAAGDLDRARALTERAEAAAWAIADPDRQLLALADLARKAESNQARSLLARQLAAGHWGAWIDVLLHISPDAVIGIADEYLWTLG